MWAKCQKDGTDCSKATVLSNICKSANYHVVKVSCIITLRDITEKQGWFGRDLMMLILSWYNRIMVRFGQSNKDSSDSTF